MVLEQMLRRDEEEHVNEQEERPAEEYEEPEANQPAFRQRVEEQARELNDYQMPTVDQYKNVLDLERKIKRHKNRAGHVYYTGPDGEVLNKGFAQRLRAYAGHDWGKKTEDSDQAFIASKHRPEEYHDRRSQLTEYWNSDEAAQARMRRRLGRLALVSGGAAAGAWLVDRFKRDKADKTKVESQRKESMRDKLVDSKPVQKTKEYATDEKHKDKRRTAGLVLAGVAIGAAGGFIGYAIGLSSTKYFAPPSEPSITNPSIPGQSVAPTPHLHGKHHGHGQGQNGPAGGKHRANHPVVSDVRPGDYPWNVLRRDGVAPANIMPALHHAGHRLAVTTGAEVDWHGSGRHEWVDINGDSRTRFVIKKLGQFVTVNR